MRKGIEMFKIKNLLKSKYKNTILNINYNKLFFYFSYLFYKLIIPFEIKKPKFKFFIYEMIYSIKKNF